MPLWTKGLNLIYSKQSLKCWDGGDLCKTGLLWRKTFSALEEDQEWLDLDLCILCSRNPLQHVFHSNNYLFFICVKGFLISNVEGFFQWENEAKMALFFLSGCGEYLLMLEEITEIQVLAHNRPRVLEKGGMLTVESSQPFKLQRVLWN